MAMMLDWSFGLTEEAACVEESIGWLLDHGSLTPDLGGKATTREVGEALCARIGVLAGTAR